MELYYSIPTEILINLAEQEHIGSLLNCLCRLRIIDITKTQDIYRELAPYITNKIPELKFETFLSYINNRLGSDGQYDKLEQERKLISLEKNITKGIIESLPIDYLLNYEAFLKDKRCMIELCEALEKLEYKNMTLFINNILLFIQENFDEFVHEGSHFPTTTIGTLKMAKRYAKLNEISDEKYRRKIKQAIRNQINKNPSKVPEYIEIIRYHSEELATELLKTR